MVADNRSDIQKVTRLTLQLGQVEKIMGEATEALPELRSDADAIKGSIAAMRFKMKEIGRRYWSTRR